MIALLIMLLLIMMSDSFYYPRMGRKIECRTERDIEREGERAIEQKIGELQQVNITRQYPALLYDEFKATLAQYIYIYINIY